MMSLNARCFGVLAIAALSVACGSANTSASDFADFGDASASSDTTEPGKDGNTSNPGDTDKNPPGKDTGTVVEDTKPPEVPTTLDNVCERLANSRCTSAFTACCKTEGLTVKDGACRSEYLATCDEQVRAIKEGRGTFHPGAFPACAAALNSLSVKCNVPILEFLKTIAPCFQVLSGSVLPGGSCEESWQCKVADGAFPNCRDGRCESIAIVGADKMCVYSGNTRAICDYGQACAFTSGSLSGTCKAAKAIGAACNNSSECGFGNYCDRGVIGGGKCVMGRGAGEFCGDNAQCASGGCSSGRCTDPMVSPVDSRSCSGSG